jgi:hypothetical protein
VARTVRAAAGERHWPFFFFGEQDDVMGLTLRFKVEEMATLESKPRRGSGGPRTAHGKSKSSQNSRKHLIFVDRVLPEEESAASLLNDEIQAEFRLEGAMELRIGRALVQNELQAARIEKFAVQEAIKARMLAGLDIDDQRSSLRYPIPKERESETGFCTRLRPAFCVMFLSRLKRLIEKRGPRPDEDVDFIRLMYGSQLTAFAEWILIHYQILKTREGVEKADENIKERKTAHHQACILEAIETEIQAQELRQTLENIRELFEPTSDSVVLPPPDVDDRIERHRTAKMRATGRLLGNLETIRRLKGGA